MGSAHVRSFGENHIKGAILTAVADIDSAKLDWVRENFPNTALFDSAESLIESGLADAVIIATPHWIHPRISVFAMDHGLHVLTEKPAGTSVSQVREMIAAQERSGKAFGIMFNQRTNPLFAKAKELVAAGELGMPKRLIWIITNWYRTQAYYNSGSWRASWRGEGGGVLLNQAPHNLDLMQWIFGMPKRVRGFCSIGKYHDVEVEDDATLYMEYENGAVGTFITTTGEYPGTNRLEISGDLGKLVLEDGVLKHWKLSCPEREYCFSAALTDPKPNITYVEIPQDSAGSAHRGILQNFIDHILLGTPLLAPGADGINELTLSNAAYLSSWTDSWVELPLDEISFDEALTQRAAHSSYLPQELSRENMNGQYKDRWSVQW